MASPKQAETDEQKRATGVGALLKASRLRVGDDLHDIASILKIRYVYLEAIEDGRFEDLPGHTYSMGFVRAYAEHLGLDSEEVIRRFKAQVVGDRSEKSLEFPEPIPEMGIPGGAIIFIGILVAAVAYGVWYVNTSKNGFMAELIAPVPARLAEQGVGGNPPKPAAPEVAAKTEPMSKPEPEPGPGPEPVMPVAAAAPMSETASPPVPSQPREAPVAATAAAPMPEADPAPSPAPTPAPVVEKPAPVETVPTPEPAPVPEPAPAKTVAAPQPAPTPAPEPAPTPKAAKPVVPVETPSAPSVASADAPSVASADAPSVVSADAPSVVPVDMIPPAASATGSASAPGISTPKTPISQSAPEAQTAALPKAAPKTETTPAPSSGKSRIIVRAKMNSWIQVRDDAVNELLLTRLLRAGDSYAVPDRSGLKLSTGNAGALEILVDGKAVPAIGSEGTVRRNVALDADKLMAGTAANE
ncbi:MAG: helix-turn-helix domain-containing protein [Proteobacteria bacterium]|nr:helix-turn-helix domain-containing protein [Pseudomonadota bacterium]